MKCSAALFMLVALAAVAPPPAHAQDQPSSSQTRAGQLAGERQKKATEAAPPERSAVERGLFWYDNQHVLDKITAGWNGFRMASGNFPAGAGTNFGAGFSHVFGSDLHPSNRIAIDAVAATSMRGYDRVSGAFTLQRIAGSRLDAKVQAQYYEYPQEDFFGFGADATEDNRTNYLQKGYESSAQLSWNFKALSLSGGAAYLRPEIGSGTDPRYPSTEELFDISTLPGYGQQTDFVRGDAGITFDWRDNPLSPHSGGRYAVQYSNYDDRDQDALGFQRVAIELQQYVPLPNRYRMLALRAATVVTDPHAGQDVPFYYQPTLGGGQRLRGFREFRFRDRNSLLFTAEYRWEASWMLDPAVFADAGKVAYDRKDLNLKDLDVTYGVGFRLHSNTKFVSRLDLAFSREGFIPLLRFEHVF
jgi:outer membrane protein assembly factor BamA